MNNGQNGAQRWLSVFNTTQETIPAYGCMMIRGYRKNIPGTDWHEAQSSREGMVYWNVEKPNEECCIDQTESVILFNGPTPIPPNSPGSATRDYPCQAVMDNSGKRVDPSPGRGLTPKKDSWELVVGPGPFASLGEDDPAKRIKGADRTVWVTPQERKYEHAYLRSSLGVATGLPFYGFDSTNNPPVLGNRDIPNLSYGNDEAIPFLQGITLRTGGVFYSIEPKDPNELVITKHFGGWYWLSFSATVWGDEDVERGQTVGLRLSINRVDPTDVPATENHGGIALLAVRSQNRENDTYSGVPFHIAKENVAASGVFYLDENDTIKMTAVVGDGQYTPTPPATDGGKAGKMLAASFVFSAAMIERDVRGISYGAKTSRYFGPGHYPSGVVF